MMTAQREVKKKKEGEDDE